MKIFYAFHGRNAWWSTWITSYAEGCMHAAWDSAREYCEKRRVQGTVFYANELPALAFIAEDRALIVSQINSSDILSQLNFKLLTKVTTLIPFATMTFQQLTHIFKASSSFWPESFPRKDSVIQVYCNEASQLSGLSNSDTLLHKTSNAVGVNYYLKWAEKPSEITSGTVISLVNALKGRLGEP
ncbi:MAG: hypothetical protein M3461_23070 [Pseudomonadota bacterium]|nr:hypothetical protein [Pseudomonadota bacterium]